MLKYFVIAAAAGALVGAPLAYAQDPAADYPNRSVKIIVSVPAGGGVDAVTRIFAAGLQRRLGQPFVIENRGGGGGNIGAEAAYTSEPDGYTLLATQPAPITSNAALYKKLNFDPVALEPVAVMSKFPNVLLVRQDFPAKTAQEFIAHAKANPGKVNYASQGVGTTSHLTAELFNTLAGTKLVHVRTRHRPGSTIVASHVDLIFMELSAAYKLHRAARRKFSRSPPTNGSTPAGVPTLIRRRANSFRYLERLSAAQTPAPIIAKLNRAVNDIINSRTPRPLPPAQPHPGQRQPGHGEAQEGRDRALDQGVRDAGIQPE
jgi:tripartite-type tricarboxylate transporter receptor subunit TctC